MREESLSTRGLRGVGSGPRGTSGSSAESKLNFGGEKIPKPFSRSIWAEPFLPEYLTERNWGVEVDLPSDAKLGVPPCLRVSGVSGEMITGCSITVASTLGVSWISRRNVSREGVCGGISVEGAVESPPEPRKSRPRFMLASCSVKLYIGLEFDGSEDVLFWRWSTGRTLAGAGAGTIAAFEVEVVPPVALAFVAIVLDPIVELDELDDDEALDEVEEAPDEDLATADFLAAEIDVEAPGLGATAGTLSFFIT